MDDVSPEVAQVSQIGATTLIEGEYRANSDHIRTCCCKTSDNADFYHPDTAIQQCSATEVAEYKVSLIHIIKRPINH